MEVGATKVTGSWPTEVLLPCSTPISTPFLLLLCDELMTTIDTEGFGLCPKMDTEGDGLGCGLCWVIGDVRISSGEELMTEKGMV